MTKMGFRNPNLKIFEKLGGGCKTSLINRFWLESEEVGHVNPHSKGTLSQVQILVQTFRAKNDT